MALLAGTEFDPVVVGGDQIVLRRRAPFAARPSDESLRPVQKLVSIVVTADVDEARSCGIAGSTMVIDGDAIAARNAGSLAELFDGTGTWMGVILTAALGAYAGERILERVTPGCPASAQPG